MTLPPINSDSDIINATTQFTRLAELPEGIGLGSDDLRRLRIRLLAEEFKEYLSGESAVIDIDEGGSDDIWLMNQPDRSRSPTGWPT